MTERWHKAAQQLRESLSGERARLPWLGPHLQTLRNTVRNPQIDLSPWPARLVRLAFKDGDETLCYTHQPQGIKAQANSHVVLIHGLGGDASGTAIGYLAQALLSAGWPVTRVNLRAAPMVSHLASKIAHAGRTEDLRDIFHGLDATLGPQRWCALGISLGGNLLAKALGDGALKAFDIAAAMTICAPIHMKSASDKILEPGNRLYARHLLKDLKAAVYNCGMGPQWQSRAQSATSVYDFDDRVTGPFHGFGDAETYYARSSAAPYLNTISVPTLLLTAADDPWIPTRGYEENETAPNHPAQIVISPQGGHVGFHFRSSKRPAYCATAAAWFKATAS